MESKYGKDYIGVPITIEGSTMWVNEHMLFATIMAIVTYMDNTTDDAGSFISIISEKIYEHITQSQGPIDRSGATSQGPADRSEQA